MVITISPTHSSSSSHIGTLPARRGGKESGQRSVTAQRAEPFKKGVVATDKHPIPQEASFRYSESWGGSPTAPTPVTHVVRAAGVAGNGCQQPQKTEQFPGTQGALDHDPSQVERPHPSPRCHEPPSRSTGAGDRRKTSEGRPNWEHSFRKTRPLPPEDFPATGWA